jgi:hypothetical protein
MGPTGSTNLTIGITGGNNNTYSNINKLVFDSNLFNLNEYPSTNTLGISLPNSRSNGIQTSNYSVITVNYNISSTSTIYTLSNITTSNFSNNFSFLLSTTSIPSSLKITNSTLQINATSTNLTPTQIIATMQKLIPLHSFILYAGSSIKSTIFPTSITTTNTNWYHKNLPPAFFIINFDLSNNPVLTLSNLSFNTSALAGSGYYNIPASSATTAALAHIYLLFDNSL